MIHRRRGPCFSIQYCDRQRRARSLQAAADLYGVNFVRNWSLEDSSLAPWAFYNSGSQGTFVKASCAKAHSCTGLNVGEISGTDAPYTFAHQKVTGPAIAHGGSYVAWARIQTVDVAGNGARLRVDFRDAANAIIRVDESAATSGSSNGFVLHTISGKTIPAAATAVYVEVCGSTNGGIGASGVVRFDDVHFKSTPIAPPADPCVVDLECPVSQCIGGTCCYDPPCVVSDLGAPDLGAPDLDAGVQDVGPDVTGNTDFGIADDTKIADVDVADITEQVDAGVADIAEQVDAGVADITEQVDAAGMVDVSRDAPGAIDAAGEAATFDVAVGNTAANAEKNGPAKMNGGCSCGVEGQNKPDGLLLLALVVMWIRRPTCATASFSARANGP